MTPEFTAKCSGLLFINRNISISKRLIDRCKGVKPDMNKLERVMAELPEAMRAELEDFWLERERLRSPKSQLTYAFMALSLARTTGLKSFRELDREHFRKWHRWLRANMSESSRAPVSYTHLTLPTTERV